MVRESGAQFVYAHVPAPDVQPDLPFRLQVSALSYSSYVGVIGVGRIERGRLERNARVTLVDTDGAEKSGRILQIFGFHGLDKVEQQSAEAGQIIAFTGIDGLNISDTICDPEAVEALPPLVVDEPTITMSWFHQLLPAPTKAGSKPRSK